MKRYYVYILAWFLANKRNCTFYTEVNKIVWYEQTNDVRIAIDKEKKIRKWNRQWKLELIEEKNPN